MIIMAGRPQQRTTIPTIIGAALLREIERRKITRAIAGAELGVRGSRISEYIAGLHTPTLDPRRIAAFLHHEDGRAWTLEEVVTALQADRSERDGFTRDATRVAA